MKRMPFFDNPVLRGQLPMWRARLVLILLFGGFVVLAGRALFLQGLSTEFLQQQGERRYERTLTLSATRGKILDRNGVVLASSVPARAIWAIPEDAKQADNAQLAALANLLGMPLPDLRRRLADEDRNFVYLKRQVPMEVADKIKQLSLPGIHQQPESLRYYPEGEVTAHVVGFNNVEDKGQEGVELAFNDLLSGRAGSRRVIKDRLGRVIEDVQAVTMPVDGRDLRLSIDTRVQYLLYKELQDAMQKHEARAATAVVLDVQTGEILAMASLPTFDPNRRDTFQISQLRNQAITDTFEPGSIMKPFTAALALDLGRITPSTLFETGNGRFQYQGSTITDVSRHNGTLNVAGILLRSSNIGMTMISERLEAREMWNRFTELGLGQAPQLGFPGAAPGRLRPWERWRLIEKATMAYGYGLSVSLLQVARAYTVFARDGDMVSLTLVKRDSDPTSVRVYPPKIAQMVRGMLEGAAGPDGAKAAMVQGYRVAGKSGTARKIVDGKYSTQRYRSSFVGFAPVSNPKIVVAVSIDEPKVGGYYGGAIAAPVFSRVVSGSLRLMGVQPDAPFESTIVAGNPSAGAPEVGR
ncbi:peptidoglycan synthetase [Bordetella ansorpii]|uniref:Peptidoglycan D,D-transpeptidase FtsI n=1 Tax=Bordetella ansorpii TaxID=288768 RepID=A0A157L0E8_9BORD|nr:penicillin-binding protein 2 [Bordetella ansorpii]SAH90361.1 peptidoglycan synthetase [Bordetella ansorpii]